MQIEQNFRDEKSKRYGLGLRQVKAGEKTNIRALPGCSFLQHHHVADGILH